MKARIKDFCKSIKIEFCNIAKNPDGEGCLIVCLFPYYVNNCDGNISKYARGIDYHGVCKKYMKQICDFLVQNGQDDFSRNIHVDTSPYNERRVAMSCGLGFIGKSNCLINDELGSYFFIGIILCPTLELEVDVPLEKTCMNCGECIRKCPADALSVGFYREKCLSHVTQKKGLSSQDEEKLIKDNSYIWGCDICQDVCVHNKNIKPTQIIEFREDLIYSINNCDIISLTNKSFLEKYKNRAFTWHGLGVIKRNIKK